MSTRAYYELQAAQALFDKPCSTLDEAQRRRMHAVALRHQRIETAVLGSTEASTVCLPPGAVDEAFDNIAARYDDPAAFADALAEAGLDPAALREALARKLHVDAVMAHVGARVPAVDATEAEIFYYTHLERFRTPERRTARHILVTINEDIPDNQRDAASARIGAIAARLALRPERFAEQALKHSECPTAMHGGLLGDVIRGQLYPELETALFALPEGGCSAVVESELGLHLLRCERIHPERTLPWAEVAESLRARLTEARARRASREWLENLLADARASVQTP